MKSFQILVCWLVLLAAASAQAQYFTNYPTLEEPIPIMESYGSGVEYRRDQSQAAFLLILLNLLNPIEGIDPELMAPPEHLEAIGISKRLYYLEENTGEREQIKSLIDELDLGDGQPRVMTDSVVKMQKELAERILREPEQQEIARLAAISFVHPDPMIRIAAAPLLVVLTDGIYPALEELRRGIRNKDYRLAMLASTLLARLVENDSALDRFSADSKADPGLEEDPQTTVVVHGTFASDQTWWRNGYPFFEYLEHEVSVNDLFLGDDPFGWSGQWSHDARVRAARELIAWTNQHQEDCLNIVAHSHGSNVGFLASEQVKFGRMIMLSTPAHPHRYEPVNYESLFSLRVRLDLVVLADGGGNKFPDWDNLREEYFGWFNHSATHDETRWEKKGVKGILPTDVCPQSQ
jgi:hypothetical protein